MRTRVLCSVLFVLALVAGGCSYAPRQPDPQITIAAVSMESRVRDVPANLARIEYWARQAAAAHADLVLLPAAAISGWWQNREIRKYAEPVDGPSIRRLIALARELNIIIAVGMTETDGKRAHITHVLLDGKGVIGKHRKSQLAGGANGEAKIWDPGNDANVFVIRGLRFGVAICYESVNPETCRKLRANGAQIILAPYANGTLPEELTNGKRAYPAARAKENGVWYVACDAPSHHPDGSSCPGAAYVINPAGDLVALTAPGTTGENMIVYTIRPPRQVENPPPQGCGCP